MPSRSCVPNCQGNYDTSDLRVSVFSFPKEEELRKKWMRSIPRDNFIPTKSSRVCEVHFKQGDIERETSAYDSRTGKKITASLDKPRPKKGAVPSVFPGCPSYLSLKEPDRETPEQKKRRIENEQLEKAVELSLKKKEEEENMRECKDKWKNLRSVFVRNQKIPANSRHKKPYYLADAMKFTLPFIKTQGVLIENVQEATSRLHKLKKQVKEEPLSPDEWEEISRDQSSEGTGVIVYDEIELQPETPSSEEQSRFFEELNHESFSPSGQQDARKRKRMATDEDNNIEQEFVRVKTREQQQQTDTSTSNSGNSEGKKMFLMSLLSEIEPLTDSQMRSFRRRVLQLIDDITNPSDATRATLPTD